MPKAKKESAKVLDLSSKLVDVLTPPKSLPTPEPGVYEDVPEETYHLWDAVSNSRLTKLARSPAHLKASIDNPKPPTPALKLGTYTHRAVLEPDIFASRYRIAERCCAIKKGDGERCTNMGIILEGDATWYCGTHRNGSNGRTDVTILSDENYRICVGVSKAFQEHPRAAKALYTGKLAKEVSIVWIDPETGLKCKARFDVLAFDLAGGTIIDLKSTTDARKLAFSVKIYQYGYHRQGAFYVPGARAVGLPIQHYAIAPFEKEPPYAISLYRLDEGTLDAGEVELRKLMRLYAECLEKDQWPLTPGYSPDIEDISIPSWAYERIATEDEYGA